LKKSGISKKAAKAVLSAQSTATITEPGPAELQKFPYPFQGAFAVCSDIDSSNISRFRAVHALFCGNDVIRESSPEWQTLGLTSNGRWFDKETGGINGLGFDFADSFFLVGDRTTFGMYRYMPEEDRFSEDEQEGENCASLVRHWLKQGQIDCFHAFLHYTRCQVEPLLKELYHWCESEGVRKPAVWINHSAANTPSGLCPNSYQPNRVYRLARLMARGIVGPLFGRKPQPLRNALVRFDGDTPDSRYYVNDLLAANGLRFVWLNIGGEYRNKIALPEQQLNGRSTILEPVTMDDGIRYWRFERCYGAPLGRTQGQICLRDSIDGYDSSHLISEKNLEELCRLNGTCILVTHWTHFRSMPIMHETITRFALLRSWAEMGKIWVTSTARLLEWTRLRTFLKFDCRRETKRLVIDIKGLEDPIFGRQPLSVADLEGIAFRFFQPEASIVLAIDGQALGPDRLSRAGNICWVNGAVGQKNRSDSMSGSGYRAVIR
jgi:hypothetical protein